MKKKTKEVEISSVDVHDSALMVKLGIHQPEYLRPDFTKTEEEKKALKKLRTKHDKFYAIDRSKPNNIPVYDKLIITTSKERGNVNVFSCKCYGYQIVQILRDIYPDYIKYSFNGRTYYNNAV